MSGSTPAPARLSVVIPAHDAAATLGRCLGALAGSRMAPLEIIVVDDASSDATGTIARGFGIEPLAIGARGGPAQARNRGAEHARGDVLVFLDADVLVAPDSVERVAAAFAADPGLGALFGSYDARPSEPNLVSQFRNLLHHHVHQTGRLDAGTFWAGFGAVRREAFLAAQGFSEAYGEPAIEDIELGMRLRRDGARIRLIPALQVKHLKRWSLASMVKTDVLQRALPWSRLVLRADTLPDDLNLARTQRWSGALVCGALAALAAACVAEPVLVLLLLGAGAVVVAVDATADTRAEARDWRLGLGAALLAIGTMAVAGAAPVPALAVAGGCALGALALNRRWYAFLARERGLAFAILTAPLHALYFAYSTATFGYAWLCCRGGLCQHG